MPAPYMLDSPQARDVFTRLVLAYRDAEESLVRLVADAVKGTATGDYYTEKLRITRELGRAAQRVADALAEQVTADMSAMLLAEYEATAMAAAGGPVPQGVGVAAVKALAAETAATAASASLPIIRQVQDTYQEVARQIVTEGVTTGANRLTRLQSAMDRFADRGVTAFVDQSGRRWSMDTYAEMVMRTGVNRAQNAGRRDGFQAAGIDLILTSSHKGCAPQCLPYQGRILSLTGQSGSVQVEGPDGEPVEVWVTATFDDAVANGYHHQNCRHVDTAYSPGMPVPPAVESDEEDYQLTQRQRQIERNIRKWKLREAGALDDVTSRKARGKVRHWQAVQRQHVKKADWLVRQYDREKVITGRTGRLAV